MHIYYQEVVKGKPSWITPVVNFRIFGFKPILSFFIRLPFLRTRFIEIDYKVNERIIENIWLYRLLNQLPAGVRILDIGCVSSFIPFELATMGYKVTGIDIRKYPLSHPNFSFISADVCKMPFLDESFDLIVAISTIEHIGLPHYGPSFAEGDKNALKEIYRCLRPAGLFYISVPFGKKTIGWQRIYDFQSLADILKNFDILESKYYQCFQYKFWLPAIAKELEKVASPGKEEVNGVAIILCKKQSSE